MEETGINITPFPYVDLSQKDRGMLLAVVTFELPKNESHKLRLHQAAQRIHNWKEPVTLFARD
jgi:hypothetical protein